MGGRTFREEDGKDEIEGENDGGFKVKDAADKYVRELWK